jgi:hypothetical protein
MAAEETIKGEFLVATALDSITIAAFQKRRLRHLLEKFKVCI